MPKPRDHATTIRVNALDSRLGALLRQLERTSEELARTSAQLTAASHKLDASAQHPLQTSESVGTPANSAEAALQEFRVAHEDWYVRAEANPQDWAARSEAARQAWLDDGLLVSGEVLARAWGRSRQALETACKRDELFRLRIGKRWWYPAVFETLAAEDVARVCRALTGGDVVSKFLFWHRKHGGIGARTIAQALQGGQVGRAEELALGLAEESGWRLVNAPAT